MSLLGQVSARPWPPCVGRKVSHSHYPALPTILSKGCAGVASARRNVYVLLFALTDDEESGCTVATCESSGKGPSSNYSLTQQAPFKFSVKKVARRPLSRAYEPTSRKIKIETCDYESPDSPCQPSTSTGGSEPYFGKRSTNLADEICQSEVVPPLLPIRSHDTFLTPCRLLFMKTRAYYIIKRAGFNPNEAFTATGLFPIAPEMTDAAANVSFFPDDTLNRLMSKLLFIYPTITNIVSATAFAFWCKEELHSYKLPLKFQARHQNTKKPIIPGQESFFRFWDTIFSFSTSYDRVIKLENAIKNFRYALVQPASLNLSFFTHLTSPVKSNSDLFEE